MSKVWFVTGSSRGFGRQFVKAALERGDRVAATARNVDSLSDLVGQFGKAIYPLALDVTHKAAAEAALREASAHFGRLDIVVNNAGYGQFGFVEEVSEEQVRAQMETNFFGALWVTQAAVALMRQQGSGHIIQISSIGGVAAFPSLGLYHASKWALEGMSESLAQEVAGFGIKVTIVEPGGFSTDWGGSSAVHARQNDAYASLRNAMAARRSGAIRGDPVGAANALLRIVDAQNPPLRVLFGGQPVDIVKGLYAKRLETWAQWEELSRAADCK